MVLAPSYYTVFWVKTMKETVWLQMGIVQMLLTRASLDCACALKSSRAHQSPTVAMLGDLSELLHNNFLQLLQASSAANLRGADTLYLLLSGISWGNLEVSGTDPVSSWAWSKLALGRIWVLAPDLLCIFTSGAMELMLW